MNYYLYNSQIAQSDVKHEKLKKKSLQYSKLKIELPTDKLKKSTGQIKRLEFQKNTKEF